MTFRIQVVTVSDGGHEETREITALGRHGLRPETLGLTLAEGKAILKDIQEVVDERQTTTAWLPSPAAGNVVKRGTAKVPTPFQFGRCSVR